jgi:hypothetical protein
MLPVLETGILPREKQPFFKKKKKSKSTSTFVFYIVCELYWKRAYTGPSCDNCIIALRIEGNFQPSGNSCTIIGNSHHMPFDWHEKIYI